MEAEKENIYMLVPCAICGGFQSMETYVSTSQVVQFGFSDGCNWSPILWHFCKREPLQVKQAPYVKRLFSPPPPHPAASQSYRQLVHRVLLPSCPKVPRVTPIYSVYCRSLLGPWPSVAPWQTGEAFYPRGQYMIVLMWRCGILYSSKNPTTYQLTAMCRLENYKCTDRQSRA